MRKILGETLPRLGAGNRRYVWALALSALSALSAGAQQADPVLMRVGDMSVQRSEFEYAYNKNGGVEGAVESKTVEEYADMFAAYKLKVVAALRARLDTLTSFQREFHQYRDEQLTPFLTDPTYIDSVVRSIYTGYEKRLGGQQLIRPSHILLLVKQNASEEQRAAVRQRIDSLTKVVAAGGDFADLARRYSQDPGSARQGGLLPWLGPGMTLKAFDEAAYALKKGEISPAPVETEVGYHLIQMTDRKDLESYEELLPNILESLRAQGIENASAEARIARMVAASDGRLSREAVLDSVLQAHQDSVELRCLVQEYHDGLLLYEAAKRTVWDPAEADREGQAAYFKKNRKHYAWTEPRFRGFVLHAKTADGYKAAEKLLRKFAAGDWRGQLKTTLNKDSVMVRVSGPFLARKGDNGYIDHYAFGAERRPEMKGFPLSGVVGKVQKQPKTYVDALPDLLSDYKAQKETEWVEQLRREIPVEIDQSVLATVNKH